MDPGADGRILAGVWVLANKARFGVTHDHIMR